MLRLARATPAELEDLVERAVRGVPDLEDCAYPDGCVPGRGPVRIERHHRGGLIVRVTPGSLASEDFRVTVLFELGACVFGSLDDLHGFCCGPLAEAFGLRPATQPLPERRTYDGVVVDTASPGGEAQMPLVDVLVAEARAVRDRRALTTQALAERLSLEIHGQEPALERVASVVAGQLAKQRPTRPGSVLLVGPTGVGKTATIEALPTALRDRGYPGAHVHRIDCGELADDIHLTRVLGVGPGYVGPEDSTALLDALREPGVIVLLDEIEKANRELHDALLGLLDTGTLTDPAGHRVSCPHAIVALTSNAGWSALEEALVGVPLEDRVTVTRTCRAHLAAQGVRAELVGRIGGFAVYAELPDEARRDVALRVVRELGWEYGVVVDEVEKVVLDVVLDLADGSGAGARGLYHAARDLLAECIADAAAAGEGTWSVLAGPPPVLVRA